MKYLSPIPKQFVDQNGLPLSNGAVHVYISGDTQYANVYREADGEELMLNPARLDSNGAWQGFVTAGVPLDYVVEDKDGNVQFEYEKVVAAQGGSGSQVAIEPVLTSGTKIAECWVDGELLELFAPEGGGGSYTAGNNITITNGVISATDTKYYAGDGLNLGPANQFNVERPLPDATNRGDYVLTGTGNGDYGWKRRGNVLADNSTGKMSITLTTDDITNGFADFELEPVVEKSLWAIFASIVQVRPMNGAIDKIEFGFKNNIGDFYQLISFDSTQVHQAMVGLEVKDWAMGHFSPWNRLVCRWTLADGHSFGAGDVLSTHYNCLAVNGVTPE